MKFAPLVALIAIDSVHGVKIQNYETDGFKFEPVYNIYGNVTSLARKAYYTERFHEYKQWRDRKSQEQKQSSPIAAASKTGSRISAPSVDYSSLRAPNNCVFPLDILILQDATGSFENDFLVTADITLPAMSKTIPERHPGTKISLVTYKDKPYIDLGWTSDYCHRAEILNANDAMDLEPFFREVSVGGGQDFPENQYGALIAVLKSPKTINWHSNELATQLVIHITDSQPHFEADSIQWNYPQFGPWGADYDEDLADDYCHKRYYPTPDVVKNVILDSKAYVATIVVRPEDPLANPLPAWEWFNSFVGFPDSFVQPSLNNFEGWFQQLLDIIHAVESEECSNATETTPEPTDGTNAPAGNASGLTRPAAGTTVATQDDTLNVVGGASGLTRPAATTTPNENAGNCVCPDEDPDCCKKQPEVLIALMKRPENLDIHLVGPEHPDL